MESNKKTKSSKKKRNVKKNKKKIGLLLWIFIILTVVPLLWALGVAVTSWNAPGLEALGILTPFLLIPYLLILWSIYGIIMLFKFFVKIYKKNRKLGLSLMAILSGVIIGIIISYFDVRTGFLSISANADDILIDDGKVYYISDKYVTLTLDKNDYLNVVNVDGSKNKTLCRNIDVYDFDPKFIKNDEIYYYDIIRDSFNKINISSCENKEIMEEYEYIYSDKNYGYFVSKDMVEDGKEAYNIYVKYDFLKNEAVEKIEVSSSNVIIDFNNFDIYYMVYNDDQNYIYKNGELIYSWKKENVYLLGRFDNSLLLSDNNTLYKFDLSKNKVVDKVKFKMESHRGLSDMSGKYFHTNDKIYMYTGDIRNLEVILDGDTDGLYEVDDFGDYVVFRNYNNSDLTVYNKINKEYKIYVDGKYSYDYKNAKLYVLSEGKIIEVK